MLSYGDYQDMLDDELEGYDSIEERIAHQDLLGAMAEDEYQQEKYDE